MWKGLYHLCQQTVTLYHAVYHNNGQFDCFRWVIPKAHFEYRHSRDTQTSKTKPQSHGLVVLPQQKHLLCWVSPNQFHSQPQPPAQCYTLQPGDKILLGEGPEITTREQWATLTPYHTHNLIIVQSITSHYFMGQLAHLEIVAE